MATGRRFAPWSRRQWIRAAIGGGWSLPHALVGTVHGLESGGAGRTVALVRLRPGMAVESPSSTWNHWIVKSVPRLASGDLESLPDSARSTATLYRTVILARSTRLRTGEHELDRVGIGICVPHQGRDLVVSYATVDDLAIPLSIVQRVVLGQAETELSKGRITASTRTFALFTTPSVLVRGGRHVDVDLSYAMLLDRSEGSLMTVVWSSHVGARDDPGPSSIRLLKPGLTFDCPLDVEANRLLGAIPVSWSFAMKDLPPGRPIVLNDGARLELARRSGKDFSPDRFESLLRTLVSG